MLPEVFASEIGVLLDTPKENLGPEGRAALVLAQRTGQTKVVSASSEGVFRDESGKEISLEATPLLWYHQGDTKDPGGPAYSPITVVKLRKYVGDGHALLLSGAALGMVQQLNLEPFGPRRAGPGSSHFTSGLKPEIVNHPAFRGLRSVDYLPDKLFMLSDGGHGAFSDFYGTPGPSSGMVLARANSSSEDPLVEYELGKGRVIVLGWRIPFYSYTNNPYRQNLERLTANLVGYLSDPKAWQRVVLREATVKQPGVTSVQWQALEMAIQDLAGTYKGGYPSSGRYLSELKELRKKHDELLTGKPEAQVRGQLERVTDQFKKLQREALLANPLLEFGRLLFIERTSNNLGLPANWESNSSLSKNGFTNRLCILSPIRPEGQVATIFEPGYGRFLGDVDLHWKADRMLFSMPGGNGRWQVFELGIDGRGLRELPLITEPDVDNYDACYLPDGRIIFTSTAPFVGVPCVYGSSHVANLYIREHNNSIRQLTVDQEHNWCPQVLNNGRVVYLRWEYTDLPHSNSRRLFHMNPDGTRQAEYLSSSSYFPNSFFYARPIPKHPTMVVGIATGHHGNARSGRLLLMDPTLGRQEAEPVVQEIPGHAKKVQSITRDQLADGVWPQFLHPFPLSDKYFLVSAKLRPESFWGIYLVDVFDNMVCIFEKPGYAMLEPILIKQQQTPPTIIDRIDRDRKDSLVYIVDIYEGGGLRGIPKGTVKNLRLFTYHFSYQGMGGLLGSIGMDGPWDIKQVLGTVPVEADGSAFFRIPAYTPIAVQPLDSEGKAMQLMRSWFTGMPGEMVSCVGCHEKHNSGAISRNTMAGGKAPEEIRPYAGAASGFSFAREVQPVIDQHCVRCHNGKPWTNLNSTLSTSRTPRKVLPDLRSIPITNWTTAIEGNAGVKVGGKFSSAYAELHRFVRRPGIESDIHMLTPMEYHADSTELVQLLRKGHAGVRLDQESWQRLITWIDLNAPYHGTWQEIVGKEAVTHVASRARTMRYRFTGMNEQRELIPLTTFKPPKAELNPRNHPVSGKEGNVSLPDLRFDASEAQRRQEADHVWQQSFDLGRSIKLNMVKIPAGQFVMGDADGWPDEKPRGVVKIARAFWMGRFEINNEQYAQFDGAHDSHVESMHGYQFGIHGYPVNGPKQPVVRVSWERAKAFCQWLSQRTGRHFDLPTEAQWEYACRAGTDTPFSFGGIEADFSPFANMGDIKLKEFALETYIQVHLVPNPTSYDDWVPRDNRFNDGGFVTREVGSYRPNPWRLHDMHGNAWEWTRSKFLPYPLQVNEPPNSEASDGRRVVRGGSWYDRPMRCTSSYRLAYYPYQNVFNVGFRVIMEEEPGAADSQTRN